MRQIICIFFILCFLSAPVSALCLFESDYDRDRWTEERIIYDEPEGVPDGWLPLRAVSEHLPIDVSWDEERREVVVYSHDRSLMKTFRYKADKLPAELVIKDGVTYCSPRLLASYLQHRGFLYNGEVYFFNGESKESRLIQPGDSDTFKAKTIAAMYQLKLKLPAKYAFARKYLTGGIVCAPKAETPSEVAGAFAYIYPTVKKPTCYIVGDQKSGTLLANFIVHEAFHVWQYKNGGLDRLDEGEAWEYGQTVQNQLEEIQ